MLKRDYVEGSMTMNIKLFSLLLLKTTNGYLNFDNDNGKGTATQNLPVMKLLKNGIDFGNISFWVWFVIYFVIILLFILSAVARDPVDQDDTHNGRLGVVKVLITGLYFVVIGMTVFLVLVFGVWNLGFTSIASLLAILVMIITFLYRTPLIMIDNLINFFVGSLYRDPRLTQDGEREYRTLPTMVTIAMIFTFAVVVFHIIMFIHKIL